MALLWLTLSCIVGVAISYLGWRARSLVTATCYTVLGVANKMLTVFFNVVMWDQHASSVGILSLVVCLAGAAAYQQAPMRDEAAEKADAARREACAKYKQPVWIATGLLLLLPAPYVYRSVMGGPPVPNPVVKPSGAMSVTTPSRYGAGARHGDASGLGASEAQLSLRKVISSTSCTKGSFSVWQPPETTPQLRASDGSFGVQVQGYTRAFSVALSEGRTFSTKPVRTPCRVAVAHQVGRGRRSGGLMALAAKVPTPRRPLNMPPPLEPTTSPPFHAPTTSRSHHHRPSCAPRRRPPSAVSSSPPLVSPALAARLTSPASRGSARARWT